MAYRFQLSGKGLGHSWQKDCPPTVVARYARLVAHEYAKDAVYRGAVISVMDDAGTEIAVVSVPLSCK